MVIASSTSSEPYVWDEALADELERRKGVRTYIDMAGLIGVSEGMLRLFLTGRADAGMNTLAPIMAWDLEQNGIDYRDLAGQMPVLTGLVFAKFVEHGQRIRVRLREAKETRSEEDAARAA